jgi:hypothetical protein
MHRGFGCENIKKRGHLKDLCRWDNIKMDLKKWNGMAWTGLIWLRIGASGKF